MTELKYDEKHALTKIKAAADSLGLDNWSEAKGKDNDGNEIIKLICKKDDINFFVDISVEELKELEKTGSTENKVKSIIQAAIDKTVDDELSNIDGFID